MPKANPSSTNTWKKILGIKVVDRTGISPGDGRAIVRNISKILSLIVQGLGFLWVAFSKEKKGWHDMIAKTFAIHNDSEIYITVHDHDGAEI